MGVYSSLLRTCVVVNQSTCADGNVVNQVPHCSYQYPRRNFHAVRVAAASSVPLLFVWTPCSSRVVVFLPRNVPVSICPSHPVTVSCLRCSTRWCCHCNMRTPPRFLKPDETIGTPYNRDPRGRWTNPPRLTHPSGSNPDLVELPQGHFQGRSHHP